MPSQIAKAGTTTPEKITAAHVRAAIKRHYPHPEFGVVFEVAHGTGWKANRHLDAIVMDTWPSRGLTINGIEVKVDLYDWRREKANPEKAEQLARFCDYFYIAAPKDLVPVAELPKAWGLLELDGAGKLHQRMPPQRTNAEPVTKDFLAGVMRAAGRPIDTEGLDYLLKQRSAELEADFQERVDREAERKTKLREEGSANWTKLMTALGEGASAKDVLKWGLYGDETLINVIAAVRKTGVMETWHGLAVLQKTIADFKLKLDVAMLELHVPVKKGDDTLARRTRKKVRA